MATAGTKLLPISRIAKDFGLSKTDWEPYGRYIAKVSLSALQRNVERPRGRLILVTSITPTPRGEGKTLTSIGIAQALRQRGYKATVTLRQPSLGPIFGSKGGATGGGRSQVHPSVEINLHLTGDSHAVASANNLLAALIDNELYRDNPLRLDSRQIMFRRCVDMNDRALRHVVINSDKEGAKFNREEGFVITAASEVMAILALSKDLPELKERLGRIVIGFTRECEAVRAKQFRAEGAMTALLKEAIKPNLVQTMENGPALIHAGPFGNVAQGSNSILANYLALARSDYAITETGFGSDLGAEKFFDVVAPQAGLPVHAVVLVASVRALKIHGGLPPDALGKEDLEALERGFPNLQKHASIVKLFGFKPVVAINRFPDDTEKEIDLLRNLVESLGLSVAVHNCHGMGGAGGLELADLIAESANQTSGQFNRLYSDDYSLERKIHAVATRVYGASGVEISDLARSKLDLFERNDFARLPICMAKTQLSLSDDPKAKGVPRDWTLSIRDVNLSAGAGFVVAIAGKIELMPGLGKEPAAYRIDVDEDGLVSGV